MLRNCTGDCDEEIDHEEYNYCPYCGESTREIEYLVIRRYNFVGDADTQTFDERREAVECAREMVAPENNADHYDWSVEEDPDGDAVVDGDEVVFYAEEGDMGGRRDMPQESVTVRLSVVYGSRTSAGDDDGN